MGYAISLHTRVSFWPMSTGLLLALMSCGRSVASHDHDLDAATADTVASPADADIARAADTASSVDAVADIARAADGGSSVDAVADIARVADTGSSGDAGLLPVGMVTGMSFAPVTDAYVNPPPPVYVVVTDASRAQDAYDATLALPVFSVGPSGRRSCPIDWGVNYQLTFSFSNGSSLTVVLDPGGCQLVPIPGSSTRTIFGSDFWNQLAQDLGIPVANIYPYVPPGFQSSEDPQQQSVACKTDADCDANDRCGYRVSDGCAAKGVCMVSACTGANCAMGAPEVCGCAGQTIRPVWSQSSASSVVAVYASAPASGRSETCAGSGDAGGRD
jgi:hypothetical protein